MSITPLAAAGLAAVATLAAAPVASAQVASAQVEPREVVVVCEAPDGGTFSYRTTLELTEEASASLAGDRCHAVPTPLPADGAEQLVPTPLPTPTAAVQGTPAPVRKPPKVSEQAKAPQAVAPSRIRKAAPGTPQVAPTMPADATATTPDASAATDPPTLTGSTPARAAEPSTTGLAPQVDGAEPAAPVHADPVGITG
ncbi:hypothetical protein [Demequina gelatinilytica]|uniref:hypothetical protein n=1 Tax=Demequina gelatinilytica TaxID=1638980 RepID=UPI00078654F5|nr:hypothetical protein [Demequina gelatinilytica]